MILQELIRNIVLYKGVVNPYLQSVKEYVMLFVSPRYKQIGVITSLMNSKNTSKISPSTGFYAYFSEKTAFNKFAPWTGTHTIPNRETIHMDQIVKIKSDSTRKLAMNSNTAITMLIKKSIDISAKTYLNVAVASTDPYSNQTITSSQITTGFFKENTYIFFSHETHEKREYLGEFSLPHEENRFTSLDERR